MRRTLVAAVALAAIAAILLLATLPPLPVGVTLDGVDPALLRRTVSGAYHIHTTRSDGAGDKASIAAAAKRAGLQFAIFTDHGDGTRRPDPPEYLDGVLCIDAVEISTRGGHYAALGLAATPYPLGGEPSAVVEDVRRLGGFGIAAHPDHPKRELAWTDWTTEIDGVEWINADSEWRTESPLRIGRVLFDYLVRPAPALASILDRPEETLGRWESLLRQRAVIALAAADAHGGARSRSIQEGGSRFAVGPAYETSFRTVTNRVLLDRPFSGDAVSDGPALLEAIRRGRVYSVIDAVSPTAMLDGGKGQPLAFASPVPSGATVVRHGSGYGRPWLEAGHPNAPGDPPVPWVLAGPPVEVPAVEVQSPGQPLGGEPIHMLSPWRIEKDPRSSGRVLASEGEVIVRYALGAGERTSQYVAAAGDVSAAQMFDTIVLSGRAERPMRVSVQLRLRPFDARWTRSVYLDNTERSIVIPVEEMQPADPGGGRIPEPVTARSVLFVVDLTNARPGDAGSFTIRGVQVSARSPAAPR